MGRKQIVDPSRAIGHGPAVTEKIRIAVANDALICGNDNARSWIDNVRLFVERNETGPFATISRTIVGHATVAALANRNEAGAVITNVTVHIGIDQILRWPAVMTKRFREFLPVARTIRVEQTG